MLHTTDCVHRADSVLFSLLDTAVMSGRLEMRPSNFQVVEIRRGKGSGGTVQEDGRQGTRDESKEEMC